MIANPPKARSATHEEKLVGIGFRVEPIGSISDKQTDISLSKRRSRAVSSGAVDNPGSRNREEEKTAKDEDVLQHRAGKAR